MVNVRDKKVIVVGTGKSGIGSTVLLEKNGALPVIYDGNEKTDTEAVKLYYYDKKLEIDITDFFDSEGVCRVAVRDGGKLVYFTIRDNGGGDFDFEKTVDEPENAGRYIVVE